MGRVRRWVHGRLLVSPGGQVQAGWGLPGSAGAATSSWGSRPPHRLTGRQGNVSLHVQNPVIWGVSTAQGQCPCEASALGAVWVSRCSVCSGSCTRCLRDEETDPETWHIYSSSAGTEATACPSAKPACPPTIAPLVCILPLSPLCSVRSSACPLVYPPSCYPRVYSSTWTGLPCPLIYLSTCLFTTV